VITDIHGNRQALEAIIEDLEHQNVDEVVVAGDTVNGLPDSKHCWQMVNMLTKHVLKGNHEYLTYSFQELQARDSVYMTERFAPLRAYVAQFSVEDLDQMRELPITLRYPDLLLTHATPRSLFENIDESTSREELREIFARSAETFIVRGHNHEWLEHEFDGRVVTTIGSCGLAGRTNTQYAILTNKTTWRLERRCLTYDRQALLAQMDES
jgi:predicted phosphodiesterase